MIEHLGLQFIKRLAFVCALMLITALCTPLFPSKSDALALITVELVMGGLWTYLSLRDKTTLF